MTAWRAVKATGRGTKKAVVLAGKGRRKAQGGTAWVLEPTTALIATCASILTYGALEVRRSWTAMGTRLRRVGAKAAEVAEYAAPAERSAMAWWKRAVGAVRHEHS